LHAVVHPPPLQSMSHIAEAPQVMSQPPTGQAIVQTEDASHWSTVQVPATHSMSQVAPTSQLKEQSPPAHRLMHVEPAWQS
jgi:hypothetical protein